MASAPTWCAGWDSGPDTLTGAGVAASGFGLPDIGLVGMSEMMDRVTMVAGVLGEVPLIADGDTGYGPASSVARTVRAYERAGAAAIQLEDQAFPKRCGHLPGKELISAEACLAKLGAALDARTDALIIARIGREITAPKLINIVASGLTPELDAAELGSLGYAIAIYPTTALLAVATWWGWTSGPR